VARVEHLLALIGFAFVSSVTPGPNNILLWASGTTFGFRRTIPHVIGTAVGLALMAFAAAAGVAGLVVAVPALGVLMRLAGSAYLLWLAWQIWRSGEVTAGESARPMSLVQATGFQFVNPKAWIFAIGAVTTFRLTGLDPLVGAIAVPAVMAIVILPSASIWAAFGDVLGRLLSTPRSRRIVNGVMAILVVATIALVWV
jgi:threonine/homoserine/homoserine lactone efflux protein